LREDAYGKVVKKRRLWPTELSPLIDAGGLVDAFRTLHPQKQVYSRFHPSKGAPTTATRIDYILASRELMTGIKEIEYITSKVSDHKMMKIVVAYCMEDIDATQNIHTSGLGPWRLFHSALTVHSFRLQSRYYARQLLDSMADQRPFKRGDWIQFKNRLRSHARAASIRTGHTRRKPADAIEQIMAQMDRLDFAIESHQEQAMDLYRKLNEAKSTLVLDVRRTREAILAWASF
jgi:hypothetical protein